MTVTTVQSLFDELSLSIKHQCKYSCQRSRIKLLRHKQNLQILLWYLAACVLCTTCVLWWTLSIVYNVADDRRDWHDWQLIEAERAQYGAAGEMGDAAYLPYYPAYTKAINDTHGYNGYLSDHIALNRSLKDLRPIE